MRKSTACTAPFAATPDKPNLQNPEHALHAAAGGTHDAQRGAPALASPRRNHSRSLMLASSMRAMRAAMRASRRSCADNPAAPPAAVRCPRPLHSTHVLFHVRIVFVVATVLFYFRIVLEQFIIRGTVALLRQLAAVGPNLGVTAVFVVDAVVFDCAARVAAARLPLPPWRRISISTWSTTPVIHSAAA